MTSDKLKLRSCSAKAHTSFVWVRLVKITVYWLLLRCCS